MFSGGFGGFGGFGGMSSEEESVGQKKEVNTTQYYQLLQVPKTATIQQIRKAFRKKALKAHPDKGGDPQVFKKISGAYQVLSNPEKRQLYDQYGEEGVQNGGAPGGGFGDIFDMFRRKQSSGPKKGKPRLVEIDVTLAEIYNGAMKLVKIKRYRACQPCDGKGGKDVQKCPKCKGRKVIQKLVQLGPGMYTQTNQKCPECKATGQIMKEQDRCKKCKGQKVVEVERTLEVAIEPGCPDEHDYIFTGENDQYPGIIAGDVYVRVKIQKHKVFTRKGADLVIIKKISLLEALTGVTLEVQQLDGKKHVIATAPGQVLSNKQLKTIKKMGLPFYKDPMSHGNLYIQFFVQFPKKNFFSKEKIQKLKGVLGMEIEKSNSKIKPKYLSDYHQADLNLNPQGGQERQRYDQRSQNGGRQQVKCQQQ